MAEQTVSFSVDASLLSDFSHAAAKNLCSDTELLKAFMSDYVQHQARTQQYDQWFRGKVEKGLTELDAGLGISQEQALAQMNAFKASFAKDAEGSL